MKKYILFAISGILLTSCLDTSVLPNDVTIGEDFWKDKADVSSMVSGTYKAMCAEAVIERCIVWGDFRSDDLNTVASNIGGTKYNSLKDMAAGNMDYNNTYSDWTALYQVINRCNIVLSRARDVVEIDPSYTLETYNTDESQMLALRALCYFYLVRAFRDVPYSDEAFMNSSQQMLAEQQAPAYVLQRCIDDLEAALQHPLSPMGFQDWRRYGLLNRDAINAILADVYLWRASMMHSTADFQKAIQYCDAVIDSKKRQNELAQESGTPRRPGGGAISEDAQFPLISGEQAYEEIFINGNSSESIFELQMDGTNDVNSALCNSYWMTGGRNMGLMAAPQSIFNKTGENMVYANDYDYRYWDNCFKVNSTDAADLSVRKMVDRSSLGNTSDTRNTKSNAYPGSNINRPNNASRFQQNWIFYRLSDIMLMKAEALVQLNDTASFVEAFNLVREVNKRSMADTLQAVTNNCVSQSDYEQLVLQERQRELCFEGKRWFDLVRYSYRHVDGIQADKTLYEIAGGEAANVSRFVQNYPDMMSLMVRKYSEGGNAIGTKMNTEAHLYFPILNSEQKANYLLHQNPVYDEDDVYVKTK